jgi:hypothetical protein
MQEVFDEVARLIAANVPKLLGALAVLVLGWLAALAVAAIVRKCLQRTTLDEKLTQWIVGKEKAKTVNVEKWITRGVFYVIMLFVLVAFFQVLDLTLTTEPINRLLTQIFEFLPGLIGALLLLLAAWVVASIFRMLVSRLMTTAQVDERLAERAGFEADKRIPLTKTVSEVVYWLVFLFFLPAILGALQLEGLLTPVERLVNKILDYLPHIFLAAVILLAGWFLARIAQRIAANLLSAAGTDRFSEKIGLAPVLGTQKLSGLLGLLVYVLVLVPVLIAALEALKLDAITQPASNMLNKVLTAVPSIIAAVLLLIIAYLVGQVVAKLAANLLAGAGFNNLLARLGLGKEGGGGQRAPSDIAGWLVLVAIMLFASIEALRLLTFDRLAELVANFLVFAGHLFMGLVIFGVGLYLANVASKAILSSQAAQARLLAMAARVSIIILAGAMALRQMNLANEIITLAFGLALGAVALAVAIAFGLGARETAGRVVDEWHKNLKAKKP